MTTQTSIAKVQTLSRLMWESRIDWTHVTQWLDNFARDTDDELQERAHALFLLSHFTYLNLAIIRTLLRSLFRDFVLYPAVQALRAARGHTRDLGELEDAFQLCLSRTRFLGIGNPSESGNHLLYYFRQENALDKQLFVHSHELFHPSTDEGLRARTNIDRVVFLDDFCGSGSQAIKYSKTLLMPLRAAAPNLKINYYTLFATTKGLANVRKKATAFDDVQTVCELDSSFRSLEPGSRYFADAPDGISLKFAKELCTTYGTKLCGKSALGYKGGQLLLGFSHNIPNNTLPIFWAEGADEQPWTPIFRRYRKK